MTIPGHAWRRSLRISLLVALVATCALGAEPRIVGVGDIHGDYEAFTAILRQAHIIDSNLHWISGQDTLVQVGDMLDRGPKDRQVMDLLMALQQEAPKSGGRVVVVLGNHEVMNMMGDLRYVTPEGYAQYATPKSEEIRQAAYRAYVELTQNRAKALGLTVFVEAESKWMQDHPLGFIEQREQFRPDGKYGQWLRQLPAVEKIGGVLFLHGGISPEFSSQNASRITESVHSELKAFDGYKKYLEEHKIILPFFTLAEMTRAAQTQLRSTPVNVAEQQLLFEFLQYPEWDCVREDGPLWFRGYSRWTDAEGQARIPAILRQEGVEHIVVGHTPEANGRILPRFGAGVFLIDTGMLSSFFGGQASALEIQNGKFTAIYPKERMVLLESKPQAETRP